MDWQTLLEAAIKADTERLILEGFNSNVAKHIACYNKIAFIMQMCADPEEVEYFDLSDDD